MIGVLIVVEDVVLEFVEEIPIVLLFFFSLSHTIFLVFVVLVFRFHEDLVFEIIVEIAVDQSVFDLRGKIIGVTLHSTRLLVNIIEAAELFLIVHSLLDFLLLFLFQFQFFALRIFIQMFEYLGGLCNDRTRCRLLLCFHLLRLL